jgi:hypothetical protein
VFTIIAEIISHVNKVTSHYTVEVTYICKCLWCYIYAWEVSHEFCKWACFSPMSKSHSFRHLNFSCISTFIKLSYLFQAHQICCFHSELSAMIPWPVQSSVLSVQWQLLWHRKQFRISWRSIHCCHRNGKGGSLLFTVIKGSILIPAFRDLHVYKYSETSIHRFCQGSEKEAMDPGKQ